MSVQEVEKFLDFSEEDAKTNSEKVINFWMKRDHNGIAIAEARIVCTWDNNEKETRMDYYGSALFEHPDAAPNWLITGRMEFVSSDSRSVTYRVAKDGLVAERTLTFRKHTDSLMWVRITHTEEGFLCNLDYRLEIESTVNKRTEDRH